MAPDARRAVGSSGEDAVVAWYEAHGYQIVARNWRVRAGEIDVIARTRTVIVFCEVKTRRSDAYGVPAEAVTATKQHRIRRLASEYFATTDAQRGDVRFDVAAVTPNGNGWSVDVLEGVF